MDFGKRLEQEREEQGWKQKDMAAAGDVSTASYSLYVKGERAPNFVAGANWHKAGVDVLYVISGERSRAQLSVDEQELLKRYHAAPLSVKAAVLGALTAGSAVNAVTQNVDGDVGQQAAGNITNEARTIFTFGGKKSKSNRS